VPAIRHVILALVPTNKIAFHADLVYLSLKQMGRVNVLRIAPPSALFTIPNSLSVASATRHVMVAMDLFSLSVTTALTDITKLKRESVDKAVKNQINSSRMNSASIVTPLVLLAMVLK